MLRAWKFAYILGELFYADQNLCLFIRLDDAESWVEEQIVILDQYFISDRRSTVIHNEKSLLNLTVPIFDKLKTAIRLNTILNTTPQLVKLHELTQM